MSFPGYLCHIYARQLVMRVARIKIGVHTLQAFFVEAISCRKKQIAEPKRRTQIFATRGFHSFATTAQLRHFPSTRLRL
jgi:hypothetical protein